MNIHKSITFNSLFFRKDSAAAESSAGTKKNESRKATKPTEEGTIAAILPRDKEASLTVDAITKFDLLPFMGRDACAPFLVGGVKTAIEGSLSFRTACFALPAPTAGK